MDSFTEPEQSGAACCTRRGTTIAGAGKAGCWRLTPHRALALSHIVFILLILTMLLDRWWQGGIMAEKNCSSFLPHICLLSECINGLYHGLVGYEVPFHIFVQSVIWVCISAFPLGSSAWILSKVRPLRCWDVLVSLASCSFLVIGLIPDLLPGKWIIVHISLAGFGLLSGFVGILSLKWHLRLLAVLGYIFWYFAVCWWLVLSGAAAPRVFDWAGFVRGELVNGTLTPPILEWVGVLGACSVCMLYCLQEDRRQSSIAPNEEHEADLVVDTKALVAVV